MCYAKTQTPKYKNFFVFENIDIPSGHIQSNTHHEFSPTLIKYIKNVENGINKGYKNGIWHMYQDPTGPHIGFGHKIENNEMHLFKNGITDKQANELLIRDLTIAKGKVYSDIKHMFKVNIPTLDQHKEEMLIDFAYNLGTIRHFPKFVRAVLLGDWKTATAEYKRSAIDKNGKKIELGRNNKYFDTFLKNI